MSESISARRGATLALAVTGLLLAGCNPNPGDLVGEWKGEHSPEEMGFQAGDLKTELWLVKLHLRADGRFSLVDTGIPIEGTWQSAGDEVRLNPTHLMSRPLAVQSESVQRAIAFTVRRESDALLIQSANAKVPTRLKRAPRP